MTKSKIIKIGLLFLGLVSFIGLHVVYRSINPISEPMSTYGTTHESRRLFGLMITSQSIFFLVLFVEAIRSRVRTLIPLLLILICMGCTLGVYLFPAGSHHLTAVGILFMGLIVLISFAHMNRLRDPNRLLTVFLISLVTLCAIFVSVQFPFLLDHWRHYRGILQRLFLVNSFGLISVYFVVDDVFFKYSQRHSKESRVDNLKMLDRV